jgi:hypothetical protein
VKRMVRSITYSQASDLSQRMFGCSTAQEVEQLLRHEMRTRFPEYISGALPGSAESRAGGA